MTKEELGIILATQLIACFENKKLGSTSSYESKYSYLTEDGRQLMMKLIDVLAPEADQIRRDAIKEHAEKLMVDNIKA